MLLFLSTFRYPKSLAEGPSVQGTPLVSILIATFNEKFVIANTLDAIKNLDYPRDKLLVVVADDSSDETVDVIDRKILEQLRDPLMAQAFVHFLKEGQVLVQCGHEFRER